SCKKFIRAASRLGWFDAAGSPAVFVLPNQVLGQAPEEIVYQPDVPMNVAATLHGHGKLKDWQDHVAQPCLDNPVLMFSIMLGLAGPLLKHCQVETGGFHLYGVTTSGKTTAAQLAASVWGCAADPQEGPEVTSLRKWYTTGNALESLAEVHNDMLLTLDEISEVDPQALGQIIYQLAGGLSKGRANAGGGLRGMRAWRLLFLSTGEKSVRQMLAQAGQLQKGGQRVRLPDIPVDNDEDGSRAIVLDPGQVQKMKLTGGRIFVITSGMMSENTAAHDLAVRMAGDEKQSIFFVGYADPSTPGGRLKESKPGETFVFSPSAGIVTRHCDVQDFDLTAHANRDDLLDFVGQVSPRAILLGHGGDDSRKWFEEQI
ncbi:MAG: DUF927 domain-containing protein, partial [Elusimicrobiota bacterium]